MIIEKKSFNKYRVEEEKIHVKQTSNKNTLSNESKVLSKDLNFKW